MLTSIIDYHDKWIILNMASIGQKSEPTSEGIPVTKRLILVMSSYNTMHNKLRSLVRANL